MADLPSDPFPSSRKLMILSRLERAGLSATPALDVASHGLQSRLAAVNIILKGDVSVALRSAHKSLERRDFLSAKTRLDDAARGLDESGKILYPALFSFKIASTIAPLVMEHPMARLTAGLVEQHKVLAEQYGQTVQVMADAYKNVSPTNVEEIERMLTQTIRLARERKSRMMEGLGAFLGRFRPRGM